MENVKKKAKIWLCIGMALMLLCMIVVSVVQTGGGKIHMEELKFETESGYAMSAYLFVPENASIENPAPAIVTSHGYLNNKEMQDANYVELARRGFVVLAIDQPCHGDSDNPTHIPLWPPDGVYQGALALAKMPFVDVEKIGITGHSMGGMSSNAAVAADNASENPIISAVLLNSADAVYTDGDGNYVDIYGSRDVAILSCQYDEFFHGFTDEEGNWKEAPYFMENPGAQSFLNFGVDPEGLKTREAYTMYTETIDGEEAIRVIYRPAIIHPWSHFSARSTACVIEFFDEALGAPNAIGASSQIWQVKEGFNFAGIIGLVIFLVSFTVLMVHTPYFSSLKAEEIAAPVQPDKKGKLWFWGSLVAGALFSVLIYIPILKFGTSQNVNQTESLGIGLWAGFCGIFTILSMVLSYQLYGKKNGLDLAERGVKMPFGKLAKTVLLALIVATVSYSWVFFADYFFKADFRIWTLAMKAFDAEKLGNMAVYMWPFMLFYIAASIAANSFNYNTVGGKLNNFIVSFFVALPAIVLPCIQYITYFTTKAMMWPESNMHVLWLFPIILILFGSTYLSRYIYKATKNPYLAGIVNGLIISIMTVTNTCTTGVFPF